MCIPPVAYIGSCWRRLLVDSSTSSLTVSLKVSCCCLCRPPPRFAHPASSFYLFFTQRKKQLHITIRTVRLFTWSIDPLTHDITISIQYMWGKIPWFKNDIHWNQAASFSKRTRNCSLHQIKLCRVSHAFIFYGSVYLQKLLLFEVIYIYRQVFFSDLG